MKRQVLQKHNLPGIRSDQISRSVVSDSLRPHGLQHARLPCPSATPRTHSNWCPLSRWCHSTISSSVVPFSSHLLSFPASGLFQWVSSSLQEASDGTSKESLDESERGEWKSWLKAQHSENKDHGIWSHHFIENGETVETVTDFIFLGSKITADDDCSHEIKRPLLLGRKAMTNIDSILKSRDLTFPTKVSLVKPMVFPVVYGCESWTVKKAEPRRIDAFELCLFD